MRYFAAICLSARRWVAPALLFTAGATATFAAGGSTLPNAGIGAALLLPIAAWITVLTLTSTHATQEWMIGAAAGSRRRVRRAMLLVAAATSLVLAALSVLLAAVRGSSLSVAIVLAAIVAHAIAVAAGVALGAVCSPPLIARGGSALIAIGLLTVLDVVAPDAPPEHLLLSALEGSAPRWGLLGAAAVSTAPIAAGLIAVSGRIAERAG